MSSVGIDLGTTNSVVAALNASGQPVALRGRDETSPIVPSVVYLDNALRTVVGNEAKEQLSHEGDRVASFFKRQMGDRNWRFSVPGREMSAIELSAEVLKRLKQDAQFALNIREIKNAVVTVPAYFYDAERKATEEAAALAGLNILQLINEPTAAAVAFGASAHVPTGGHVLVFDLGGGTFDVTLLQVFGDDIHVITSDGDAQLGGKDWDARIVDFIAEQFRSQTGMDLYSERSVIGDLWVTAEKVKKDLSARSSVPVRISHAGEKFESDLTREFFEMLTGDLTARTMDIMETALSRGNVHARNLDMVLLVGGSTRMPMVQSALEKLTGKKPHSGVNPDQAVALGAALCAAGHEAKSQPVYMLASGKKEATHTFTLPSGKSVRDVSTHSLGVIATNTENSAYVNDIILAKDKAIPRADKKSYKLRTKLKGQNLWEIFLTQGEDSSPANVKYLGRYTVADVPHDPSGTATVEAIYSYNRSGSIEVTASTASGQLLPVKVETLPEDVPSRFMRPPPKPTRKHITIYLTFDLSGSMSGSPLEDAKDSAIQSFLDALDLLHTSIGVIVHSDRVKTILKATSEAREIRNAINSMAITEGLGYGNAQHPFDEASRMLRSVEDLRFVVSLTDGVWSDQEQAIKSAKTLHSDGVEVIALGFGGADQAFLRRIASSDEHGILSSQSHLGDAFSSIAQVISAE